MLRFPWANNDVMGVEGKNFVQYPEIGELLSAFIAQHRAGSPTDERVYWIHLKPREIAQGFAERHSIVISNGLVKRHLHLMGYKYRKLSKQLATGQCADRQAQFHVIFTLVAVMSTKTPIISMDCKKKERLGNLYRAGKCYTQQPIKVYDRAANRHDYHYLSEGSVVPHGIYDLQRNQAYLSIGTNHETATFITDNLRWWWESFGMHHYPQARTVLILCDAGGANSYRHHAFKKQMLHLAHQTGIDFIVCHYPPYASKHNPIEHRLFPHLHRAMEGVVFTSYQLVKELMGKTTTSTGLNVKVRINDHYYPIGIKTTPQEVDSQRIQTHPAVPKLCYRICA